MKDQEKEKKDYKLKAKFLLPPPLLSDEFELGNMLSFDEVVDCVAELLEKQDSTHASTEKMIREFREKYKNLEFLKGQNPDQCEQICKFLSHYTFPTRGGTE